MEVGSGQARCPGTCGEWVQGARAGVPFLVDCPINRFSEATVRLSTRSSHWQVPRGKDKVDQVLKLIIAEQGLTGFSGQVTFSSELPSGKGMASSTADIVAAAAATLTAIGETPDPEKLARWALEVEPSDSVMFPGITEINHVHGDYYRVLGPAIPAQFLALDWGGFVNTLDFNARQDLAAHYRRCEPEIRQAYDLVWQGVVSEDLEKLALGSTISARCNSEINPKPQFEKFYTWVRRRGGLGVITAHSGTILAGVFEPDITLNDLILEAKEVFRPLYMDYFQAHGNGITWQDLGG